MNEVNSNEIPYFDLITTGIGYLNRARTIKPNQGSAYECVSIAALHGRSDSPSYAYFDCRVVGTEALEFVKTHKDAINDRNTKVLVRFNVGDGEATSYVPRGAEQEQRRHQIKGRLLKITWAKIGDEVLDLGQDKAETPVDHSAGHCSGTEDLPEGKPKRWEDTLGDTVRLDSKDPHFLKKVNRLKEVGYIWDSTENLWHREAAA